MIAAIDKPRKARAPIAIDIRLWRRVNKNGPAVTPELGPCWLWEGCVTSKGYGSIGLSPPAPRGTTITTHKLSWQLVHPDEAIPAGMVVRHRCDVKRCVRPEHLELGTPQDNSDDAVERGLSTQGERNGHCVLTAEQVLVIRGSDETDDVLAGQYGVSPRSIWDIRNGRTWKHLPKFAIKPREWKRRIRIKEAS